MCMFTSDITAVFTNNQRAERMAKKINDNVI